MLTEELLNSYSSEIAIKNTISYLGCMPPSTLYREAYDCKYPENDLLTIEKLMTIKLDPYKWYMVNLACDLNCQRRIIKAANRYFGNVLAPKGGK
jgi:hypothetical protein